MDNSTTKIPSPLLSLVPILVLVSLLFATIRTFGSDALSGGSQIVLLTATAVCCLIAMGYCKVRWKVIELAIINNITGVATALLILLIIGALSGSWMISGPAVPGQRLPPSASPFMELWIKDLKYFKADRMSCHFFSANYFRLFLYAAAYVMAHKMKRTLFKDTQVERFTMDSFIKRIMLSAVYIREKKTYVRISFSPKHRHRAELEQALIKAVA